MTIFDKIIVLSKKIASSLLKDEKPDALENSDIFNENDKAYILKNLTNKTLIKERLDLINQIEKKEDWKKIKKTIKIPKVKHLYWRYAAAAIFIGIITSTYLFRDTLFGFSNENIPVIVNNNIKIGEDKATLTLENGTVVALGKGSNYQAPNLTSNGEKLVYNSSNNTSTKATYNYLTIPRGGQFFVQLSDGTQVWLNSESKLKFPTAFTKGDTRKVELIYGEAYFDVTPSTKNNGSKFKVINNNQEVEVLGTEFNIKAYKDETIIYTTLVEGKVAVSMVNNKQCLKPNQQLKHNLKNQTTKVETVDVYNEVSWKEGVFSFENKPLNEIMKVLSRWYNMNVLFENTTVETVAFTGVLGKDQKIEEILKTIKNFGIINNYEIKDKTITLK